MTLMWNREKDGAGNPISNKRVYIMLVANGTPGYSDNGEISIESVGEVLTDMDGRWEADLTPNVDIVPEGTVYSARLKFRGGDYEHIFIAPDSGVDNWIGDHLVDLPGTLTSGALSAHLLDALAAHKASSVEVTPAGGIVATQVQAALQELDSEISGKQPIIPLGTFLSLRAAATNPETMITGNIIRNADGVVISADVSWDDGTPGIYAATPSSTFVTAVESYYITYGSPVTKTYTQPTMTRDIDGNLVTRPAVMES